MLIRLRMLSGRGFFLVPILILLRPLVLLLLELLLLLGTKCRLLTVVITLLLLRFIGDLLRVDISLLIRSLHILLGFVCDSSCSCPSIDRLCWNFIIIVGNEPFQKVQVN